MKSAGATQKRLIRRATHAPRRLVFAGALLILMLAALAWTRPAGAQASSWLYVGGGAGVLDQERQIERSMLQVDTGLGLAPSSFLVLGGIFRGQMLFGSGLDLALLSRLVTREFARGGFGAGIDLGGYHRPWGEGSTGLSGNLVLGAPWGLTLIAGGSVGSGDQRSFFASLGIDFARLTVHRHSGLDWFPNPMRSPPD